MAAKIFAIFCVSAVLVQTIAAECINSYGPPAYGPRANSGYSNSNNISPIASGLTTAVTNAGSFTVTTTSPIAPSGVSVVSEYVIEGPLSVTGELPVLSGVGVDGQLPTGGQAGTVYTCGSGTVGMSTESLAYSGVKANNAGNFAPGNYNGPRLGQRRGCA